jgi:indolepyruvate ferredoxin oxidoreductase alpha subunit
VKTKNDILLGNEAIARGLVEAGIRVMTAYPGTPSSEILPAVERFSREMINPTYCEWSVNEKVALENALAATYLQQRAAVAMKQVGLNVALDPLMSAAYIGIQGGLIVISADDPGPHSSQTEQDSRLLAYYAKLPVFDPDSPAQARELIETAFSLSERHEIPVILRPTMRLCHARQNIIFKKAGNKVNPAVFTRDPARWAATPRSRLALHQRLNQKLILIADELAKSSQNVIWRRTVKRGSKARLGILASGVSAAMARDLMEQMGLDMPFLQLTAPFPLPLNPVRRLQAGCERVLVLEETEPLLELLAPERDRLWGRFSGHVESAGELTPEKMASILEKVCRQTGIKPIRPRGRIISIPDQAPSRKPNLCAGCGHRSVFYAMRRAFPQGIFPGDIGCYTLGVNQGAVDTCHDMGASINFASSLSRMLDSQNLDVPVLATIGDSTFFHSGPAGLINAVYNQARFILLLLDNATTSMTGMQPTPGTGITASGQPGGKIDLERLIRGCGVETVEKVDAYDIPALLKTMRRVHQSLKKAPAPSPGVIICSHPCLAQMGEAAVPRLIKVKVAPGTPGIKPIFSPEIKPCADCGRCLKICPAEALTRKDKGIIELKAEKCISCRSCAQECPTGTIVMPPQKGCTACGLCLTWFACPGLSADRNRHVQVDPDWCINCGLCINVCGQEAIMEVSS